MKRYFTLLVLAIMMVSCTSRESGAFDASLEEDAVVAVVNKAIGWQLNHMPKQSRAWYNPSCKGWADGVFLSAAAGWQHLPGLRERLQEIAESNNFEPAPKCFNPANGLAVSMLYASLYSDDPKPRFLKERIGDFQKELDVLKGGWQMLTPTIERLDFQMKYWPETTDLDFLTVANQEKWSWCDALYMSAPTYAMFANLTGRDEYRDFMDREFWNTAEYLYSRADSLFWRDSRFFDEREPNGEKVFWGRGNGWVIAALCRVLDLLPPDHPSRGCYEQLFREMIIRLSALQGEDGFWRTSLLDPQDFPNPESSATGFITYGLWWGINRGLIEEGQHLHAAESGWKALVSAVTRGGKVGWVQPIGDTPDHISADKNEVYGTAALVMAGGEVLNYINSKNN